MTILEEWKRRCEGFAQWKSESIGIQYCRLWHAVPIPHVPGKANNPQRPDPELLRRDAILLWAEYAGTAMMSFCCDVEPALATIPTELVEREQHRLEQLVQAEREQRLKSRGARASQCSPMYQIA